MKSIRNKFNTVKEFESLIEAHKRARLNKRFKGNIIKFELNLTYNLYKLKHELDNRTYKLGKYYKFFVYEPKKREIMAIDYCDRVVMHSLCDNALGPFLEKRLDYDNAACRQGKGTHFALSRLSLFMRKAYNKWGTNYYILKCDIKKYFNSIRHDVLKKNLYKHIQDDGIKWLLDEVIDSTEGNTGLPIGNITSQWFAVFYLDELDKLIRQHLKIPFYSRYMDDFVLIHKDKDYLKDCLRQMREFLDKELGLHLNEKTQIFPAKNGVDYIGFHTYITKTGKIIRKIRHSSKKNMKNKIRYFNKEYSAGRLDYKKIQNSIMSWIGHARYGDTYNLRKKLMSMLRLRRETDGN